MILFSGYLMVVFKNRTVEIPSIILVRLAVWRVLCDFCLINFIYEENDGFSYGWTASSILHQLLFDFRMHEAAAVFGPCEIAFDFSHACFGVQTSEIIQQHALLRGKRPASCGHLKTMEPLRGPAIETQLMEPVAPVDRGLLPLLYMDYVLAFSTFSVGAHGAASPAHRLQRSSETKWHVRPLGWMHGFFSVQPQILQTPLMICLGVASAIVV